MSTLNPPKTFSRRHELREDTVVTAYARAWQFFDRNRTLIYGILVAVVVLVLLMVGWIWRQNVRNNEAAEHLGRIVSLYEQGDYQQALDGSGGNLGLIAIADQYGSTDAGNLARFYAANAYFELGSYEEARAYFSDFKVGDDILGASAIAGEAAALEALGQYERAGELYRRAALHQEIPALSPQYLLDSGRAFEAAGDYDRAIESYRMIADNFEQASIAANIDAYIAGAEARRKIAQ